MEAFEYKGRWWLPEQPDFEVVGILKFDPEDGATLELLGNDFLDSEEHEMGVPFVPFRKVIDTVCGYTNSGKPCTLYMCSWFGNNWADGYSSATYKVQVIFVGYHFEKEEDIVFDSMAINYSNLDEWVDVKSVDIKFNHEPRRVDIIYRRPEKIDFSTASAQISLYHNFRWARPNISEASLKYTTFVNMKPHQPMHYNDYHEDIVYHIRNFLSLGIGAAVLPREVEAKVHIGKSPSSEEIDETSRDVSIYYVPKGIGVKNAEKHQRILFRFRDIADKFEEYLETWFSKASDIREVFDLYFGIFYIPSIYIHLEFLTLAQALETYHRRMYGGTYMSKAEYEPFEKKIKEAIPAELSKDHQKSLKSRIEYGYEYSLRKRLSLILTEVLAAYEITVNKLISNQKEFINRLVDTRNYLTHYTKKLEATAITNPYSQRKLVEKMKLLMQLCFMKEMGFPADTVEMIMSKNNNFSIHSG